MIITKVTKIFKVTKVTERVPWGCSGYNLDKLKIWKEFKAKSETECNESCRKGKSGGELNLGLQSLVRSKPNVPVTERQMVVLIATLMNLKSERNLREFKARKQRKLRMRMSVAGGMSHGSYVNSVKRKKQQTETLNWKVKVEYQCLK
jgi:hypothetical protein